MSINLTSQQIADGLLIDYQRLKTADIGGMTFGLRDNAKDLFDIWNFHKNRRAEFGDRELEDIAECVQQLIRILGASGYGEAL